MFAAIILVLSLKIKGSLENSRKFNLEIHDINEFLKVELFEGGDFYDFIDTQDANQNSDTSDFSIYSQEDIIKTEPNSVEDELPVSELNVLNTHSNDSEQPDLKLHQNDILSKNKTLKSDNKEDFVCLNDSRNNTNFFCDDKIVSYINSFNTFLLSFFRLFIVDERIFEILDLSNNKIIGYFDILQDIKNLLNSSPCTLKIKVDLENKRFDEIYCRLNKYVVRRSNGYQKVGLKPKRNIFYKTNITYLKRKINLIENLDLLHLESYLTMKIGSLKKGLDSFILFLSYCNFLETENRKLIGKYLAFFKFYKYFYQSDISKMNKFEHRVYMEGLLYFSSQTNSLGSNISTKYDIIDYLYDVRKFENQRTMLFTILGWLFTFRKLNLSNISIDKLTDLMAEDDIRLNLGREFIQIALILFNKQA